MVRRARLFLLASIVIAGILLVTEFPITSLVHARAASAEVASSLSKMRAEDRALALQVHDLKQGSTIEQIAHQEYGLVERGQQSVVVMPGGGATGSAVGGTAPLGQTTIPKSDIVPSDSQLAQASAGSGRSRGGFWGRVLDRLEFWKASA